jgi:hypothetical protein
MLFEATGYKCAHENLLDSFQPYVVILERLQRFLCFGKEVCQAFSQVGDVSS